MMPQDLCFVVHRLHRLTWTHLFVFREKKDETNDKSPKLVGLKDISFKGSNTAIQYSGENISQSRNRLKSRSLSFDFCHKVSTAQRGLA